MLSALSFCLPLLTGLGSLERPALVRMVRGQSHLLEEVGEGKTLRSAESMRIEGQAWLEVPAGAVVELAWPGLLQLRATGPASLSWQPSEELGDLHLDLLACQRADLALRGTGLTLELFQSWRLAPKVSTFHIEGGPGFAPLLSHDAGGQLSLAWMGEQGAFARPDVLVQAGQRVRLQTPSARRVEPAGEDSAWPRADWPWRSESRLPGVVRTPARVRPVQPDPAAPELPGPAAGPDEPRQTLAPDAAPALTPALPATAPPVRVVPMRTLGRFSIEDSPFVSVREYPNGRSRVLVSSQAPSPVHCRFRGEDKLLEPGGVLMLDPLGEVTAVYGYLGQARSAESN